MCFSRHADVCHVYPAEELVFGGVAVEGLEVGGGKVAFVVFGTCMFWASFAGSMGLSMSMVMSVGMSISIDMDMNMCAKKWVTHLVFDIQLCLALRWCSSNAFPTSKSCSSDHARDCTISYKL